MFVCVCMRAITYAERIAANTYVFLWDARDVAQVGVGVDVLLS